jgi:hypothetical protein
MGTCNALEQVCHHLSCSFGPHSVIDKVIFEFVSNFTEESPWRPGLKTEEMRRSRRSAK